MGVSDSAFANTPEITAFIGLGCPWGFARAGPVRQPPAPARWAPARTGLAPAGHRSAPRGWSRPGSGGTGTAPAGTQRGPHASPTRAASGGAAPGWPRSPERKGRFGVERTGSGRERSPALTQLASEQTPSTAPMAPPPPSARFLLPPTARGQGRRQTGSAPSLHRRR